MMIIIDNPSLVIQKCRGKKWSEGRNFICPKPELESSVDPYEEAETCQELGCVASEFLWYEFYLKKRISQKEKKIRAILCNSYCENDAIPCLSRGMEWSSKLSDLRHTTP